MLHEKEKPSGKDEDPALVKDTVLKEPTKADKVSFQQAELPLGKAPPDTKKGAAAEVPGNPRSLVMRTTGQLDVGGNNVSSPADAAAFLSFLKEPPTAELFRLKI